MWLFLAKALKATRRFRRDRDGNAAVEFALLALPFFVLTFGLAEVALIGFAQTSLDYAVAETSRNIRTGQAQMGGTSYSAMKNNMCTELNGLMTLNCAANLSLDVDTFASFVAANNDNNQDPMQGGTFNQAGFGYNPGQPSSIVVVRAYYQWQVLTPFFQPLFQNISGGKRVLVSTMMFRNEPYQTN